ncbi:AAA family ATPase [Sulfurovum sp. bin170]|uniref:AAA family ATPase n=1 Tax=Sulfurovum sp. bin170 TaxID=2695268 RepID=UPI0013DFE173|nr:AAA family ATPase [Sulfurovum sp. bin170]NEW61478.1 AAA family ATPase [Sulfurovum sp. bin170]
MKKLPIGISDFKELIYENFYYIDKTDFILETIDSNAKVILLPRPRRFGKTLNLSMLNYFFNIEENNKELFNNLNISKNSIAMSHCAKYPIIYITFKDVKEDSFEKSFLKIKRLVSNEFKKHYKAIVDSNIDSTDKKRVIEIIDEEASEVNIEDSFKLLSRLLTATYNQKCIVLIDEYDTPIQTAFLKGYYEEMVGFFKTFMGAVLKDNDVHIYKAVLTGILRVSKESIFSDLNNIKVYTLLNREFSDKFGFTKDETKVVLNEYNLLDSYDEVNRWYDGYTIGGKSILNPWSLLNYIDSKEFDVYWANTSSNGIIRTLIENSDEFRDDLKLLLKGEKIEKVINPNITFKDRDFNFNEEMLYSFLFFSGYLKYTSKRFERGKHYCNLAVVNIECQYIFENIISNWIADSFSNRKLRILLKSLTDGELHTFERIFSEFVRDTLSFYDTAKNIESVYHAFFLGLLINLNDYEIISNEEAGYGRVDIMVLHKQDKSRLAIIMELKTIDDFIEETKDKALQSAVKQIEEKAYVSKVQKKGYGNILSFGVVFDGKRVWIEKC